MASCGTRSSYDRNASRNLYKLIQQKGKTLPVDITSVVVPIRASRRRKIQRRPWPVLHLSKWLNVHFGPSYNGVFILGGHTLNELDKVEAMLARFWTRYAYVDNDDCPTYERRSRTIPFLLHGDEGRGLCKRPVLVISYQGVIAWSGEDYVNSKKHFGNLWHVSMFLF